MTPASLNLPGGKGGGSRKVKLGSGVIVATNGSSLELRSIVQPSDYEKVCQQRDEANQRIESLGCILRIADEALGDKAALGVRQAAYGVRQHRAAWTWFVLFLLALGAAVWGWAN